MLHMTKELFVYSDLFVLPYIEIMQYHLWQDSGQYKLCIQGWFSEGWDHTSQNN